jgi:hypothetical protein
MLSPSWARALVCGLLKLGDHSIRTTSAAPSYTSPGDIGNVDPIPVRKAPMYPIYHRTVRQRAPLVPTCQEDVCTRPGAKLVSLVLPVQGGICRTAGFSGRTVGFSGRTVQFSGSSTNLPTWWEPSTSSCARAAYASGRCSAIAGRIRPLPSNCSSRSSSTLVPGCIPRILRRRKKVGCRRGLRFATAQEPIQRGPIPFAEESSTVGRVAGAT